MLAQPHKLLEFGSQVELAQQLAADIAAQLNHSIAKHGQAVIALSGGSTPKLMFQKLTNADVDWTKVVVTLVDERCVDQQHELSNAKFLNEYFLSHLSPSVTFVPLFDGNDDSAEGLLANFTKLSTFKNEQEIRFDVVILGMGNDGHTASFFPDANNIAELVDDKNNAVLVSCESPSTQVPRITWSLPMLLDCDFLALHITGASKKEVLSVAVAGEDKTELPIRAVILQQQTPLSVYYAD